MFFLQIRVGRCKGLEQRRKKTRVGDDAVWDKDESFQPFHSSVMVSIGEMLIPSELD